MVDDGSSDGTHAWLLEQQFPFALSAHVQANGGPALARNRGIEAAQGEFVVFLDDDVVPEPVCLAEHLRVHDEEPGDVVVLGPLCSLESYSQPWISWEQRQLEKQYAAMERGDWEPSYRQFWTGNASVARSHLVAAGLFDPQWLRGEDVELGWRLAQRGLGFRFNGRARGYHHAERSLASFRKAHETYGRLEVDLFARSSEEVGLDLLAGNFGRLHPAQRALLTQTVQRPRIAANIERGLCAYLESPAARRAPRAAERACSVLANLLYWRSSAAALGEARFAEVKRRASQRRGVS